MKNYKHFFIFNEYEAEQRYVCFSRQSHHHLAYNYVFEYDNEAAFIPHLKVKFKSHMPLESIAFAPLANDIIIKDKLRYHLIEAGYDDVKFYESQVQLRRY